MFRINYDDDDAHKWLVSELENKGMLRQGWGKEGLSLYGTNGEIQDKDLWSSKFISHWSTSVEAAQHRFEILSRMIKIKMDDLIVVPKTIDSNVLTICQAKTGYFFDETSDTHWGDFRHCIEVENVRHYRYSSSEEAVRLSAKFRAYQSAINNVWHTNSRDAIDLLFANPSSLESKSESEVVRELLVNVANELSDKLLDIPPQKFEKIFASSLENSGYRIIGGKRYDGKGADVDIIATSPLPFFDQVIEPLTILIQIKKKKDKDWDDMEGVDQLVKYSYGVEGAKKILINTTNEISQKAKEYARANDVQILHGGQIIEFIISSQKNA